MAMKRRETERQGLLVREDPLSMWVGRRAFVSIGVAEEEDG